MTRVGVHAGACLAVAALGDAVISGGADGRLAIIGGDGEVATQASFPGEAVEQAAAGGVGAHACVVGRRLHRFGPVAATHELSGPVAALVFEPGGGRLATAGADGVTLWPASGAEPARLLRCPGTPRALAWSPDGAILVAGLEQRVAHAWRLADGADIAMGTYPGPPLSLSFSAPGGFCASSGSPRVVCWHFDQPGNVARRTECGLGSAVAVSQVACHPTRMLIAAGYENGAVLLCQPDSDDILFVRDAGGGAVTTLAWSPDGGFLAYGAAAGEIGVVAFPALLFRPLPAEASNAAAQRDATP